MPPPPPSPAAIAARCPKLATLADLLLREDTFEALPWQYQAFLGKDFGMVMKNDNGFMKSATLIGDPGLGAFQESHRINLGVLLLDPDSEFPNHCHYQEEVYQVVSGRCFRFHAFKGETDVLNPGEFCQHSADEPHNASSAPTEPLLWLYFWDGELDGDQWFMEQGRTDHNLEMHYRMHRKKFTLDESS